MRSFPVPCCLLMMLGVWFALATTGCSPAAEPRRPIFGQITRNGKPVEAGLIRFYPLEGTAGPTTITEITAGEYRFTTEDGPYPGKHRIEIDLQVDPPLAKAPTPAGIKDYSQVPIENREPTAAQSWPPWKSETTVPESGSLKLDFQVTN